jgi:hypothetical protein
MAGGKDIFEIVDARQARLAAQFAPPRPDSITCLLFLWQKHLNYYVLHAVWRLCDPLTAPDPKITPDDQEIFEALLWLPYDYRKRFWPDGPRLLSWFQWLEHAATHAEALAEDETEGPKWARVFILCSIAYSIRVRRLFFSSNKVLIDMMHAIPPPDDRKHDFMSFLINASAALAKNRYKRIDDFLARCEEMWTCQITFEPIEIDDWNEGPPSSDSD